LVPLLLRAAAKVSLIFSAHDFRVWFWNFVGDADDALHNVINETPFNGERSAEPLSFLIDMRHGGDIFSLDTYYGMATGIYPETAGLNYQGKPSRNSLDNGGGVILPGVTADGKANAVPVDNSGTGYGLFGYVSNPARAFVYDASFVKLREVTITYSLPQSVLGKTKFIKGIDFSLIGRNLWIIHKNLPYADPEDGLGAGNFQGYQSGSFPSVRTVGANVKLKF